MHRPAIVCTALCLVCYLAGAAQIAAGQEETNDVPSWVKQTAGWWSDGIMSDDEFLAAISYLIENDILTVDTSGVQTDTGTVESAVVQEDADAVPSWVKQPAGWWSDGIMSDDEFLAAISYLIENDILTVDTSTDADDSIEVCKDVEDDIQIITWSLKPDNPPFGTNGTYTKWVEALGGQDAAHKAVAAGFDAWAQLNPSLEFLESEQPSSCGYPHINVTVGKMREYATIKEGNTRIIAHGLETLSQERIIYTVIGDACLDCLHDEPQIMLDDDWYRTTYTSADVPFDAMSVRNVVAQGFGHILGLEHYRGDTLHLMGTLYAKEIFCTPAGLSGHNLYTGLTFEYDDLGWTIPKVLFNLHGEGMHTDPLQHPASSFFVKSAQYDRVSGTLDLEFSQEVLSIDLGITRLVGSDSEESALRKADVIYQNSTVKILMSENLTEKFDGILCAYLHISAERQDTTYRTDAVIVEVIR